MHKALFIPAIIAVLFSIYVLAKWQNLLGFALVAHDEKKQIGRLAKLDRPRISISATVLNVIIFSDKVLFRLHSNFA